LLSEQGFPTAKGKARWDRSTVWAILRNPAYCGRAAFLKTAQSSDRPKVNRTARLRGAKAKSRPVKRDRPQEDWIEIAVPPIVSEQQFELAARRLQDNKRFSTRRTKDPSLLQGMLVCRNCGYAYYRTSTKTSARKLYYYRCLGSDAWRYEHGRKCDSPPIRQHALSALARQPDGSPEHPIWADASRVGSLQEQSPRR
jgi:site-specific DNA recombinase